jgi:SAM-dependent methyltransferase
MSRRFRYFDLTSDWLGSRQPHRFGGVFGGIGRLHAASGGAGDARVADPQPCRAIIKQAWRSFVGGDMIFSRNLREAWKEGKAVDRMNGVEKARSQIDVANWTGVEIGPLTRPIVRRGEGSIVYIDHASTDELRRLYANQAHIDVAAIVDVDHVWGDHTLSQCVEGKRFNYCIASHVIEHVPDLIGWLNEVDDVLLPGGILSLVIPDKRYTFDIWRKPSGRREVYTAHLFRQRKPSPLQVFDHFSHYVPVDAVSIWSGHPPPPRPAQTRQAIRNAKLALRQYVDAHCWVFTPVSFRRLLDKLVEGGWVNFEIATFFGTEPNMAEFFVSLRKPPQP